MLDKKERVIITLALSISAIMLIAVVIGRVVFFTPEPPFQTPKPQFRTSETQFQTPKPRFQTPEPRPQTKNYNYSPPPSAPAVESPNKVAEQPQAEPEADIAGGSKTGTKANLRDVIKSARTWGPAYTYSYGQRAPDFTLIDINGKQHKLSDYRGKDVLINFWATWCPPCMREIPHLIALRNTIGEDKLAMLAISYKSVYPPETTEKVKNFVKLNKINYTVFSTDAVAMPPLFSRVSGIPCSFFINPEGKIKLATEGLLSLDEIKAILEAEY
jgi:peroxiredoxin